ncbi:proline-serine-threonine phosphatase-interacting protein 2 isoform X2 [Rhinatrema bivittatum]|uniref:proline-serine-threonine phosphatase-interacting protein 2 isoform X2 n=1 Tax=Rhinatrema bivittatum TaxID=194408 RepID=UPI00112C7776|nr:proline-serine-threonine phosphatase-interacting protein 2 isoform X2 [Rhinatrema bivittatum]
MKGTCFKDNFWNSDIISTTGYDVIVQHMNDGRKNCKEFEDFLKERAVIEERYGKDLINLTKKKPCGQGELNTLKRALDTFKQQVENVGQCHIQLAQILRDEARKMEEFKEKQKLHRKKTESIMETVQKQKLMQYKKTMEAKRTYGQRCREKDEAEQAVSRNANMVNQKQQEKLFTKLAQAKVAAEDSDKAYQLNINVLEKIQEDWQNEHIKACVMYEEVRKSLEQCSIEKDIDYFVERRKTGDTPPAPVLYENYYNSQKNSVQGRSHALAAPRRGPMPVPTNVSCDSDYASVEEYSIIHH